MTVPSEVTRGVLQSGIAHLLFDFANKCLITVNVGELINLRPFEIFLSTFGQSVDARYLQRKYVILM
jgi:hypothetical protein